MGKAVTLLVAVLIGAGAYLAKPTTTTGATGIYVTNVFFTRFCTARGDGGCLPKIWIWDD